MSGRGVPFYCVWMLPGWLRHGVLPTLRTREASRVPFLHPVPALVPATRRLFACSIAEMLCGCTLFMCCVQGIPLFITFPSLKDQTYETEHPGKFTCQILAMAKYEWFEKWEEEAAGDRSVEYKKMKDKWKKVCLDGLHRFYPQLKVSAILMLVYPVTAFLAVAASLSLSLSLSLSPSLPSSVPPLKTVCNTLYYTVMTSRMNAH